MTSRRLHRLGGVVYTLFFLGTWSRGAELCMYLVQGCVPALMAVPVMDTLPAVSLCAMLIGGVSYGVGTIFFSSDGELPFAHGMWHVFVLGGTLGVDVAIAGALGV